MITIRGFAKLCGCSTQTLRYYDRIDLLKPAKVDEWTGYRYYEEEQSLVFLKIKNLQRAEFSIEEIKALLPGDDKLLFAALDRKIEKQMEKLYRIRKIKESYLREKMDMQNTLNMFTEFLERQTDKPILWQELGLDAEREAATRDNVRETLLDWFTQCRESSGELARQLSGRDANVIKEIMDTLENGNQGGEAMLFSITNEEIMGEAEIENTDGKPVIYKTSNEENISEGVIPENALKIFERVGWKHVSEWLNEIPKFDNGKRSFFMFRVSENSPVTDPGFPTLLLAVMAVKHDVMKGGMKCIIERSHDGLNHFELMQAP